MSNRTSTVEAQKRATTTPHSSRVRGVAAAVRAMKREEAEARNKKAKHTNTGAHRKMWCNCREAASTRASRRNARKREARTA